MIAKSMPFFSLLTGGAKKGRERGDRHEMGGSGMGGTQGQKQIKQTIPIS
jgi:hypothetical protein